MGWLTRITVAAGQLLAFLMRLVGLVSAVDLLLVRPSHATAPEVLLAGVLVLGGQATKDLLLALVDRLLMPTHQPSGSMASEEKPRA